MGAAAGRLAAIAWTLFLFSGCVGLPLHVHKSDSHALSAPQTTTLGRIAEQADVEHRGDGRNLSGVRLLISGDEALASLIALADRAERTLDIQYYIIHEDDSSRILLHHVRMAAERGVRVRLLVDDFNTVGEDRRFMHLGQLSHVEVRVFNPFPGGRSALWSRILASFSDIPRINHRMHNKLFVADNALAITGGRNIGDQYFARDLHDNFIDLDVVVAGAVVPQLSASFDAFWNSRYAYPIASVAAPVPPDVLPRALAESAESADATWLAHDLDAGRLDLIWAPATVLADRPGKISDESAPDQDLTIANDLKDLMRSAERELIVVSPYFVPGPDGVALMRDLVRRGVHVRVLTNSLASTDSPLVHNGYARYRVALLEAGVELSEVRPTLEQKRKRLHPFKSANASLHAKALVVDQRTVFIGSMNMDARSARTNSELGLVLRSPEIASQVTGLIDDIIADGSYRLIIDPKGRLEWLSGEPGVEQVWHVDPETTLAQRFLWRMLAPFAPERML